MEKRTPHCRLAVVHRLLDEGLVRVTGTALAGAADMGLSRNEMLSVVRQLHTTDFVKSMTSHADHRTWQDVYRPMTRCGLAYVKLTVSDDVLIVSFKES
ncbi:MAG: type II toxin-antitoxin system MqsR family toxin [Betaproteobacteria bacterium]|nr:type II toxin-antitoxin system MqsR family toxin [Betaproteobacteria bacterium]